MKIDEHIMTEFQQGNIASFYMHIYPSLLRAATRMLGEENLFLAEDCVQESVLKLYKSRKSFTTPLQMKAFLFTCVHNEVISVLRKGKRHELYIKSMEWMPDDTVSSFVVQETLDRLYEVTDSLPEDLREIFILSFEKGLRICDIAESQGVSVSTVKRQRKRLINLLRERFKDDMMMRLLILLACL